MADERKMAFKSGGLYYIFNSAKTGLVGIPFRESDPDYSLWENLSDINGLNTDQYLLLSEMEMYIYSPIEDDNFDISFDNYGVLQTTDDTHFMLKGYGAINSINITGSETCRVLLSNDNRKTWKYYNTTTSKWETTPLSKIYSTNNTVKQINGFVAAIYKDLFKKKGTIDYAIAINNTENIQKVIMGLPANMAPTIISAKVTANATTHKSKVAIEVEVDDPEGDDLTYKITRSFGSTVKDVLIDSGDVNPQSNGHLKYILDPASFEIGVNTLKFTYTDSKGLSSSATVNITKINDHVVLTENLNKYILTVALTDTEFDRSRYQIKLNGEIIEDFKDYKRVPITINYKLPLDKIKFGENNKIEVSFQDDIYNSDIQTHEINFIGEYYGILFTDISNSDPDDSGNRNKYHYYSDSLENIIKSLDIPPVIWERESKAYEIGVLNNSEVDFADVTIYSTDINDKYAVLVSDKTPFDYNQGSVTISNLAVGDTSHHFYVKVVSKVRDTADINTDIIAEAKLKRS